ncbi:MAG TPA: hypothetical protein VGH79_12180 [Gaiellaceae bacterium]|jgi:hypothetical protein
MDKRVMWMCVGFGTIAGSLIPEAWGASSMGGMSLLFGVFGGIAGIWVGARLTS